MKRERDLWKRKIKWFEEDNYKVQPSPQYQTESRVDQRDKLGAEEEEEAQQCVWQALEREKTSIDANRTTKPIPLQLISR